MRRAKRPGQRTPPPLARAFGSYSTRPRARWLTPAKIADTPRRVDVNRPGVARGGVVTHPGRVVTRRANLAAGSHQRAPVSCLISAARSSGVHAERVTPSRDARRYRCPGRSCHRPPGLDLPLAELLAQPLENVRLTG